MFMHRCDSVLPYLHFARANGGAADLLDDTTADWARPRVAGTAAYAPSVDAWQDDQHVYVEADLPGFSMEDVEVLVHEDSLVLRGARRREECCAEVSWYRWERRQGSFVRVIPLPRDIDRDNVEATLKDGVLRVKVRKAASAQPRKIEVKGAPAGEK
ncbi:MAG: Hsp20/alpha crystallin family protein [Planctomycetes bacterium]|nr:Hsp20/alpha crystallin family protein [Planctomycetota bacterium]